MPWKKKLIWEIYLAIFTLYCVHNAYSFLAPQGESYFYYFFLKAFHPRFVWPYTLAFMQIILSLISLIPLALFIYRIRVGGPEAWRWLLIFRILFDLTGHSFEAKQIISLYYIDPKIFALIILQIILFYAPSYIAGYMYAFRQDKILAGK